MNKSNANLKDYEVISRRTALLSVGTCKIVAEVKNGEKTDFYEISNIKDLQEVINLEQKGLYCEKLNFYKKK